MTSGAFQLLNELPTLAQSARARLEAVERRRQARHREFLAACGVVDPALPMAIRAAALKAALTVSE